MDFLLGWLAAPDTGLAQAAWPACVPEHYRRHVGPHYGIAGPPHLVQRSHDGYISASLGLRVAPLPRPDALHAVLRERAWRRLPDGHYSGLAIAPYPHAVLLRSLSGGERLYLYRDGARLWFCTALRVLLALPGLRRQLDPAVMGQVLATGMPWQGDATAVAGVSEVKTGKALWWNPQGAEQRWFWDGLLDIPRGGSTTLAGGFRSALTEAVAAAAGPGRPVAVTLSGGIDSAAVACAAVDAFGADQVVAYTYEFDDPSHPNETPFAREVCAQLGIRRHRVFPIRLDAFLERIPETVWRAESFVHWPKAFMLLAAERIRDDGFDRALSGFGVGSHMGTLLHTGEGLTRPALARVLKLLWRVSHRHGLRSVGALERLHPVLAMPSLRLLPLLAMLSDAGRRGSADTLAWLAPRRLAGLLQGAPALPAVDLEFEALPAGPRLMHQSFAHLLSCIDVTRWEQPLREIGLLRLSPAHFASVLPYAYLPYEPAPPLWSAERLLRPGKHLLRVGFDGDIPESVRMRRKNWGDAVISRAWLRAGVRWMRGALPDSPYAGLGLSNDTQRALARWDRRSPQVTGTALAFWQRVVLEHTGARAPTWETLMTTRAGVSSHADSSPAADAGGRHHGGVPAGAHP